MATAEDRAHLERLLKEHKKRLRLLELRKARQGDAIDPATEIEIGDIKSAIADIEQHEPSLVVTETRVLLRKQYENDVEFLIADSAARNRRQTRMEEQAVSTAQELHAMKDQVLAIGADVHDLKQDKKAGEGGRRRNLWLLIASIVIALVTAGGVVALWFLIVRAGVL